MKAATLEEKSRLKVIRKKIEFETFSSQILTFWWVFDRNIQMQAKKVRCHKINEKQWITNSTLTRSTAINNNNWTATNGDNNCANARSICRTRTPTTIREFLLESNENRPNTWTVGLALNQSNTSDNFPLLASRTTKFGHRRKPRAKFELSCTYVYANECNWKRGFTFKMYETRHNFSVYN